MDLAMVPDGGILTIRGAEEPASLASPTTITGSVDDQTGAITGASFASAPLSFDFDITSPIDATVYVDAAFSEVTPGSVTGSVSKVEGSDTLANVSLKAVVEVDLHIEVGNPPIVSPADCTASPITLDLDSVAPYDSETQRVTLKDANFSVPAFPIGGACNDLIGTPANEQLAGSGHSISLTMEGPLPLPLIGTTPNTTTLTVDPPSSKHGDEVTFTSTVTPTAAGATPTGFVQFRAGDTVLGAAVLDGTGTATFTTTELPVGNHQLTAAYQGDATYKQSISPTIEHLVAATPNVEVAMASSIVIGGQPRTATVTVTNPAQFGADVENARLTITIGRLGSGTAWLTPDRITAEWLNGDTWEPVTLATSAVRTVSGVVGPTTGFALPAGTEQKIKVRVTALVVGTVPSPTSCSVIHPTCPGPMRFTASVVEVDPGTGDVVEPISEAVHDFNLVESTRRASTVTFSGGYPKPHTVRQGYTIQVQGTVAPVFANFRAGGLAEILIDGERMLVRPNNAPLDSEPVEQITVSNGGISGWVTLPPDIGTGLHFVTIRYLGDPFFAPVDATSTVTVLPGTGMPFVCAEEGFSTKVVEGTGVQFDVELPQAVASGVSTPIDVTAAALRMARQQASGVSAPWAPFDNGTTTPVGTVPLTGGISFALGPAGTGTAESLERQGGTTVSSSEPNPLPEETVDQTITLHGPSASITVEGEPGQVVPIELEQITVSSIFSVDNPIQVTMTCTPVDGPVRLGEVVVAGTTVSADPEGPVRQDVDDVTVLAETFPSGAAGTVSFSSDRDGALGSDPVAGGEASLVVGDLSIGTHVLTASFDATDPAVPDTSGTVTVRVLPEFDCPQFADPGNGAVVRLVYLELLGRCPDGAGFSYWKGRLDSGTPPEAFARAIARTPEAVGRVVDDAYLTMLGRPADAAGRAFWTGRLLGHGRYDQLLADLGASPEFWTKAGSTNVGFVTRVYGQLLDRVPDQDGQDFWVGRLDEGTPPRALVLQLANLDEPLGVLVSDAYGEILGRTPTTGERTSGITHLRSTSDRSGLYARLIGTAEFIDRAQGFPNPGD